MLNHPNTKKRLSRIPAISWVLGACLTAVVIAIFVFNVPVKTASTYGILILIFGIKLLMHPAHHDDNREDTGEHIHYVGGCH